MRIILLRGLARESGHWLNFPSRLSAILGNACNVDAIDFPGCGKYHTQKALVSIGAMTDHARKESGINAITGPNYIVGISMGGMIALDWAQRFPDEVGGIVLINSSTGDHPFWWRLRPRAWLPMLSAIALTTKWREYLLLRNVSNLKELYYAHLAQWLAIQQKHPITRVTIIRMLKAAARFRPQRHCYPKGMILASKKDRFVSDKSSKALAEYFSWPIMIHPKAGHDLPMDDPDWVCHKIADFIDRKTG